MRSACDRYVLSFNGEIYNYRQLRADLEGRGHVFATASDTETILHLYEEQGVDCVDELRGMYEAGGRQGLKLSREAENELPGLGIRPR